MICKEKNVFMYVKNVYVRLIYHVERMSLLEKVKVTGMIFEG